MAAAIKRHVARNLQSTGLCTQFNELRRKSSARKVIKKSLKGPVAYGKANQPFI
jgi:hypothetical protein